jgi:hypothetical protein
MRHEGGCHCGNLRFALETAHAIAELPLRACQCSFCRRQGALSTSDPLGRVHLSVRDPALLIRYRFGLRTADFLVCAACGVYIGATIDDGGGAYAILNSNTFDQAGNFTQAPASMDYEGEDAAARRSRRRSRWTPLLS